MGFDSLRAEILLGVGDETDPLLGSVFVCLHEHNVIDPQILRSTGDEVALVRGLTEVASGLNSTRPEE